MAVLGASYFRTAGYSGQFGMSARGLAIDSAARDRRSSPRSPASGSSRGCRRHHHLRAARKPAHHRRLPDGDGQRLGVLQDIEAALFLRGDIDRLGIAPLTSMFWYGKNNRWVGPDWRPERSTTATGSRCSSRRGADLAAAQQPAAGDGQLFDADGLKGFGLGQRERSFEEYQDDGVFYEKRATVWILTAGRLGRGVGDAGRAHHQRRDPRQHRRLLEPSRPAVAGSTL